MPRFDPKSGLIHVKEEPKRRPGRRFGERYAVVGNSQFSSEWVTSQTGPNSSQRWSLRRLIEMSRSLQRDNSIAGRFFNQWVSGVVGCGYTLQCQPMDDDGTRDEAAAKAIEEAWEEWKRPENCTVTGQVSYEQFKGQTEYACARDGGVLIHPVRGFGRFGFALQSIEIDQLDLTYDRPAAKGENRIVNGIELNEWGRPVAYHLLGAHPGDYQSSMDPARRRNRVAASRLIHRFYPERVGAAHGTPLIVSAITALRHVERYEEAELIAARMHACAVAATYRDGDGTTYNDGDWSPDDEGISTSDETFEAEWSPGSTWDPDNGKRLELMQPQHPNAVFGDFKKAVLMGASAWAQYYMIGDDLEGANYSSLREGKLQQYAIWKPFQKMNIDREERPIFEAWLEAALTLGKIPGPGGKPLPMRKFEKFKRAIFLAPRMPWVDPLKEMAAVEKALELGITSASRVCLENGTALDRVLEERKNDAAAFEKAGLPAPAWMGGAKPEPEMEEEDE